MKPSDQTLYTCFSLQSQLTKKKKVSAILLSVLCSGVRIDEHWEDASGGADSYLHASPTCMLLHNQQTDSHGQPGMRQHMRQ